MSSAKIEDILSRATQDARKLLEGVYEAGREDMRRELVALLSPNLMPQEIAPVGPLPGLHKAIGNSEGRAHPGTVKPTIKEIIERCPNGISTAEIVERTGFKENSVRGTLTTLRGEGFTEQRKGLWFLSQRKGPLADASGPS